MPSFVNGVITLPLKAAQTANRTRTKDVSTEDKINPPSKDPITKETNPLVDYI